MSVQATDSQMGIFNNTKSTISVRVTNDNEGGKGTTGFQDIKPGKYDLWTRNHWQVAFILRNSEEPTGSDVESMVLKPTQVHYVNDN